MFPDEPLNCSHPFEQNLALLVLFRSSGAGGRELLVANPTEALGAAPASAERVAGSLVEVLDLGPGRRH